VVAENNPEISVVADERVRVDHAGHKIWQDELLVRGVTPTQFDLFATLAKPPNHVRDWPILAQTVLGYGDSTHARAILRNHAKQLRRCFVPEIGDPRRGVMRAMPGVGYYLVSSLAGIVEVNPQDTNVHIAGDGRVAVHEDKGLTTLDGKILNLTPLEQKIVNLLSGQLDVPASKGKIAEVVLGVDTRSNRALLRTHFFHLRQKFGPGLNDHQRGLIRVYSESLSYKGYYMVGSLEDEASLSTGG